MTKGLPKLDAFVRDLRDLLQQYKEAGKGKFDYTIIEAKDEETKKKAKEGGLQEVQFGQGSDEDKAEFAKGYMGLVINYGTEKDTVPGNNQGPKALSPDQATGLEFWITNKIREVRDRGDGIKHKIGVPHGARRDQALRAEPPPEQCWPRQPAGHHHAVLPVLHDGRRRPEETATRPSTTRSTVSSSCSPRRTSPRRSFARSTPS